MAGRGVQLEQISRDEQLTTFRRPQRAVVESCIGGSPAYGGICVEHGESACVMTLYLAG